MVKVREFCCGCSLRSGTFTVAWASLIFNCFSLLTSAYQFFYLQRRYNSYKSSYYPDAVPPSPYIFIFNVTRITVGIVISVIAIWALHKNKVKFLTGLHWYLCYIVVNSILSIILLIFEPDWDRKLAETNVFVTSYNYEYFENKVVLLIIYLFSTALVSYLALVVKSYRDYSLRNDAQNVQFVGPDATTVGYIAA